MKRIVYFDSEVDTDLSREINESIKICDDEIVSIQAYDTYTKKYFLFLYDKKDPKECSSKEKTEGVSGVLEYYEFQYKSEKDLISNVLDKFFRNFEFDVYSGFYIRHYDFKYLYNRCKKIGVDFNRISKLNTAYYNDNFGDVVIYGAMVLDISDMVQNFMGGQKEGESLDDLSSKYVGFNKLTHNVKEMLDWYRNDIKKFKNYSMIDVELCVLLDKKLGLTEMALSIINFSCIMPDYVYSAGKCIENFIFINRKSDLVFDNISSISFPPISGAYVLDNPPCLFYNYGFVIDFHRLYPNIILTFNISPETTIKYDEELYKSGEYIRLPVKDLMSIKPDLQLGIFPNIVVKLFELRDIYERKMKSIKDMSSELYKGTKRQRQNAKDRVNASSGLFDSKFSRFKSPLCALAVRGDGVALLKFAISVAKEHGFNVRYGDTDSLFIDSKITKFRSLKWIKNKKLLFKKKDSSYFDKYKKIMNNRKKYEIKSVMNEAKNLVDIINKGINDFIGYKNYISMDLEKIFDSYISIGVKKKYVMHKVWEDGKFIDITYASGFETKRSDCSDFSKDIQDRFFDYIAKGYKNSYDVDRYVRLFVKKFKKSSPYEIAIPKKIGKPMDKYDVTNPWLEGSKYSNKYLGTNFDVGSRPRLLYTSGTDGEIPNTDKICIEKNTDISHVYIDYETMLEKDIFDKIDDILEFYKINITNIKTGKNQSKLDNLYDLG